jgi:hypothetical protein
MLKRKQLRKRGFELQFNWIFVLIGGAIFLGFFIALIRNFDVGETQQTTQESTQELDSYLKISSAVSDTQKIVEFKSNKQITFSCIDNVSEYYVEGSIKSARYDYNAVFSPTGLRNNELIIRTLVFESPFKVMPIVYVTDKRIEYVFVGTSPVMSLLYNSMPTGVIKNTISPPDVQSQLADYRDNNYDHVVFILNDTDAETLPWVTLSDPGFHNVKDKVFAVVISTEGNRIDYGNLIFYSYLANAFVNEGSVPFLENSLGQQKSVFILGGIISHDKEIYECNLMKALKRMIIIAQLHDLRLEAFNQHYSSVNYDYTFYDCKDYYTGARGNLSALTYSEEPVLTADNFKDMRLAINNIENINRLIMIYGDCARIY